MDGLNGLNVGWLVVSEPEQFRDLDHRSRGLAHELGHVLFLSHGNGLDDNADGEPAGVSGPRRFDQYCDPLGSQDDEPVEDQGTEFTSCESSSSLMNRQASCRNLTDLQVEQARELAALFPGCAGVPCVKPPGT